MAKKPNANAIFTLVGALLLVLAYVLADPAEQSKFISQSFVQLAFILLTVAVLGILWSWMGGDPVASAIDELKPQITRASEQSSRDMRLSLEKAAIDLKESVKGASDESLGALNSSIRLLQDGTRVGLDRVVATSADFGTPGEWMSMLKAATGSVDLMGYTLHVWTKGALFSHVVMDLVQRGVNFRLLVMDPANPFFEVFINSRHVRSVSPDNVRAELKAIGNVVRSIQSRSEGAKGSIEIRMVRDGVIGCQICRFDEHMTIIPYLWSVVASESPLLLVSRKEGGVFASYQREFDLLWRLNAPGSD